MKGDLPFVFDTNVLVSAALIQQSTARQALDQALAIGTLLVSVETFIELDEVLRRERFARYVPLEARLAFLASLSDVALSVAVAETVTACRDPKDNKFLELAVSGMAQCIVTGDEDLLVLHPFRDIPILMPQAFLRASWPRE